MQLTCTSAFVADQSSLMLSNFKTAARDCEGFFSQNMISQLHFQVNQNGDLLSTHLFLLVSSSYRSFLAVHRIMGASIAGWTGMAHSSLGGGGRGGGRGGGIGG